MEGFNAEYNDDRCTQILQFPSQDGFNYYDPVTEQIIAKMNEEFAVVPIRGKVVVLQEKVDDGFELFSFPQFKNLLSNKKVEIMRRGHLREVSVAQLWLDSQNRRQYRGLDMLPQGGDPEIYNTFKGFPYKAVKSNKVYRFLEHVITNVCDSNPALFEYINAWIAMLFQQPWYKPGVALVMRGGQGVGKGFFANVIGNLVGRQHFIPLVSGSQISGEFNAQLSNKILIFADEVCWKGDKKAQGFLYSLITEPWIAIQPKFIDIFQMKSCHHIIMASNNDWIVPAGIDDRRFMVVDVASKHQLDRPYFDKIEEELNDGGYEALMEFYLNYDLSNVNLQRIPDTKARRDQKFNSLEVYQKFWYQKLNDGGWDEEVNVIPTMELYQEYKEFNKDISRRPPLFQKDFGRMLKQMCPSVLKTQKRENHKRILCYTFGSLSQCRNDFERFIHCNDDIWDMYLPEGNEPAHVTAKNVVGVSEGFEL